MSFNFLGSFHMASSDIEDIENEIDCKVKEDKIMSAITIRDEVENDEKRNNESHWKSEECL